MDDTVAFETVKGKFHHRDGTFHNLFTGGNDGTGLLATEHHGGYLGGIGQVVDAGFHHFDAGHLQPLTEFLLQFVHNLLATAAEGDSIGVLLVDIVGIMSGHLTQGGIALHLYKRLEGQHHIRLAVHHCPFGGGHRLGVNLEHGTVGVLQTPYQHQTYHHRISHLVVHLDGSGVEVAGTERKGMDSGEGINPEKAVARHRTAVFSEEQDHIRLVGVELHKAEPQEQRDDKSCNGQSQQQGIKGYLTEIPHRIAENTEGNQLEEEHGETVDHHTVVFEFLTLVHMSLLLYGRF